LRYLNCDFNEKTKPAKTIQDDIVWIWVVRNGEKTDSATLLLKEHDLYGKNAFQKYIPNSIYKLSNSQLKIFLSRLYATDGWACIRKSIEKRFNNEYLALVPEIGYCSVSKRLVEDIQRLLLRFGIVSKLRKKKTGWTHKGERKYSFAYSLDIHESAMIVKFCEEIGIFGKEKAIKEVYDLANQKFQKRKEVQSKAHKSRNKEWFYKNIPEGYRWEKITKIEDMGLQPTVCVTVPGDQTYLSEFVEHNSFSAARMAIWFYKCFPGSKVFLAAAPPEDNLKRLLWGQIDLLRSNNEDLFSGDNVKSLEIARDGEWYLAGLSIPNSGSEHEKVSKFSGKHGPYLFFILDEADAIPDVCYEGIETCMSGGFARMLIMFNPKKQIGPVYEKEKKGAKVVTLNAFNHPNVVTGQDIYPGAVTREETVKRINLYTRPVVEGDDLSHSIFELPDYLVGCTAEADDRSIFPPLIGGKRKIIEPKFSYMVLGRYPEQSETQLISPTWVKKAQDRWYEYTKEHGENPPENCFPTMGLDVAEMGSDDNVLCLRYGNYVPLFEAWNGMYPMQTGEKAAKIFDQKQVEKAFVDCMTVGSDVPLVMQKAGCNCIGIKVNESPQEKVIWEHFIN
jgi:hypothetical protein